jgi:hypothetical protein
MGINRKGLLVFVLIIIAVFYYWTAFSSVGSNIRQEYRPFDHLLPKGSENDYYNLLTHSLLKGKLYLDVKVPDQLLALKNPYDPNQRKILNKINSDGTLNNGYLYDASLYKNKYYLYFGVTPILLVFAPFHIITGIDMPVPTALLLFSILAIVIQTTLISTIINDHFKNLSNGAFIISIFVCALCNPIPMLLRRPTLYELAIGCAFFLNSVLLYLVYKFLNAQKISYTLNIGMGIVYGLLIGSRPNLIFISPALALVYYYKYHNSKNVKIGLFLKYILCFSLPLLLVGFSLALYNYLRFDSITEFGVHYQLAGIYDQTKISLLNYKNVVYNLYAYLLTIPQFSIHYPYIYFSGWDGLPNLIKEPDGFLSTPILGVITCLPVLGIPVILLFIKPRFDKTNLQLFINILYICFILSFTTILCTGSNCVRYYFDFSIYLACISVLILLKIDILVQKLRRLLVLKYLYSIIFVLTALLSVLASLEMYSFFNSGNPKLHTQIAYYLERVNPFIVHAYGDSSRPVRIQFIANHINAGRAQPIWSSGYGEYSEHVFIYYPNLDNICIGYACGFNPLSPGYLKDKINEEKYYVSKPFPVHSNDIMTLDIDLQTISNKPSDIVKNQYHILFNNIKVFSIDSKPANMHSDYYFIGANPTTSKYGYSSNVKILNVNRMDIRDSIVLFNQ